MADNDKKWKDNENWKNAEEQEQESGESSPLIPSLDVKPYAPGSLAESPK